MNILDRFAHGLLAVFGTFARAVLGALDFIESVLRFLLSGVGLSSDLQTVLLILMITTFLFGVLRLMKGRIRMTMALMLILVLAHTMGRIAHGPLS